MAPVSDLFRVYENQTKRQLTWTILARLHKSNSKGNQTNPPRSAMNESISLTRLSLQTDSARSALSSFTCSLCNKSYSRHPEYEAHMGSYDHQHRKRLQDLKQLSRDPNAAERARKAERKADAEAGLVRVNNIGNNSNNNNNNNNASSNATTSGGGGGGFKKGGFKSSFTTVKGSSSGVAAAAGAGAGAGATATSAKKNVLGDDDDDNEHHESNTATATNRDSRRLDDGESDTDDDYRGDDNSDQAYYNPLKPTGCFSGCAAVKSVPAV